MFHQSVYRLATTSFGQELDPNFRTDIEEDPAMRQHVNIYKDKHRIAVDEDEESDGENGFIFYCSSMRYSHFVFVQMPDVLASHLQKCWMTWI